MSKELGCELQSVFCYEALPLCSLCLLEELKCLSMLLQLNMHLCPRRRRLEKALASQHDSSLVPIMAIVSCTLGTQTVYDVAAQFYHDGIDWQLS